MASIQDVARKANVSITTVSRVLNDSPRVTDGTRRKVKRIIAELGYQPNPSAQALRSNRTHLIAITIPELTNPYFAAVAEGVQHIAARAGFQLILCNSGNDEAAEPDYLQMVSNKQVDGLIAVSRRFSASSESHQRLLNLGRKGVPIVALGRRVQPEEQFFDTITTDTTIGMREAMLHLLEAGHTNIAYFGATPGIATLRLDTYRAVLTGRGLLVSEDLIFHIDPTLEGGYKLAKSILDRKERPTAIIAVNDMVALGATIALQEHGVVIPDEISIVGFDDIPLAAIIRPALTTVSQPKYELGRLAAERLIGRLDGSITQFKAISLSSHLVIRNSTARAPQRRSFNLHSRSGT